jgi:crotonobetainyl-CoA:carnitine CoA-transferase CaiB-like acyl-CoA transferase
MQEAAAHLMRDREVNWGAMPLSGVFETSDGALVMVGAFKADPLGDISTALGIDHLGQDERFKDFAAQVANKPALQQIFRERFKTNSTEYWLGRLEKQDLLCAPVRSLAEALADEQTRINEMVIEGDGEVERVRVVGSPIHMTDAPVEIRIAPPSLGKHTDIVRGEVAVARRAAE